MCLVAVVTMLVLDALWLTLNKKRYANMVQAVQKSALKANMYAAITAYVLMVLALVTIVIPNAKRSKAPPVQSALRHGALFGFVAYGIYNATNLAIFKEYNLTVALMDTAWGTFLFFVVTWVALAVPKYVGVKAG